MIWDMRARHAQRVYESRAAVNTVALNPVQSELISGDQNGNIRVWDITQSACSCELVPEVGTAVRSLSIALDGSQVCSAFVRGAVLYGLACVGQGPLAAGYRERARSLSLCILTLAVLV